MAWNKKKKEIDKLILSHAQLGENVAEDLSIIDVKIEGKDQLFSAYSYSGDKLNSEFSEFIFDKAKDVPIKDSVKIKIHTSSDIDQVEVQSAIKSHCQSAYKEQKKQIKRISIIALIMTIMGIIALSALILINHFTSNLYLTSIVEIAAWVFIWEAVDFFFLQRPVIKGKCLLIQRVFMAEIEVCKNNDCNLQN